MAFRQNNNSNQHQHKNRFGNRIGDIGNSAQDLFSLDTLKPGKKARIRYVGGQGALRRRLLDMGLTPDTVVLVRKVAPLGDPIELFLRNYELTLRKEDAKNILLEEVIE